MEGERKCGVYRVEMRFEDRHTRCCSRWTVLFVRRGKIRRSAINEIKQVYALNKKFRPRQPEATEKKKKIQEKEKRDSPAQITCGLYIPAALHCIALPPCIALPSTILRRTASYGQSPSADGLRPGGRVPRKAPLEIMIGVALPA